jgi:hypothetical protein
MRPQHYSVAKEKRDEIFLIKAQFAVNSELFARLATPSREVLIIFTRYLGYAAVSVYLAR